MAARVARRELPGLVTRVACGDTVQVDPVGAVAFDTDAPMGRNTVFRIAWLTKPILAAVTMMFVDVAGSRSTIRSIGCCRSWPTGECYDASTDPRTTPSRPTDRSRSTIS